MDVRRGLAAAGVAVIAIGVPAAAEARNDERPGIRLHIENYADVRRDDLARARTEVERIFATAGVEVVWVDGDAPGRIAILLLNITRDSQEDATGVRSRSGARVEIDGLRLRQPDRQDNSEPRRRSSSVARTCHCARERSHPDAAAGALALRDHAR